MLLALDVGNTNVTIGVFDGLRVITSWRLQTDRGQTADEWGIKLRQLLAMEGLTLDQVQRMGISSVVPAVDEPLARMSRRYFSREPMFVSAEAKLGITVDVDNPREVGADRLANAAAAAELHGAPCVVVDLGTAVNFDVVSPGRAFIGGLISPGIGMSISGLYQKTARLPMVDFRPPRALIGRNTVDCIHSGLFHSITGGIDAILDRLLDELGAETRIIATGGQADMIASASRHIRNVDPDLTLKGVALVAQWN